MRKLLVVAAVAAAFPMSGVHGAPACSPEGTSLAVTARGHKFDKDCLAAPEGRSFTIRFDNQDPDRHSLAIVPSRGSNEPLYAGNILAGPKAVTLSVPKLQGGTYLFQCDVHPNLMNGTFIVGTGGPPPAPAAATPPASGASRSAAAADPPAAPTPARGAQAAGDPPAAGPGTSDRAAAGPGARTPRAAAGPGAGTPRAAAGPPLRVVFAAPPEIGHQQHQSHLPQWWPNGRLGASPASPPGEPLAPASRRRLMLDEQLTRRRKLSRPRLLAVGGLTALMAAGAGLGLASAEPGDPPGTIRTVAGVTTNYRQGGFSGDGGKASDAQLYNPRAVAFSKTGEVYIGDALNHRIRKIDKDGVITTIAGSPTGANPSGSPMGSFGGDGGPATSAQLNQPHGVAVDSKGNVYIADSLNNRIRKIGTDGIINTIVGSDNKKGRPDGPAETAVLKFPKSMFMTADDVLYICNSEGNTILSMDLKASPLTVKRVAGNLFNKRYGGDGRFATDAQLNTPQGVWVMPDGTVFFSDSENHLVRKVGTDGKISTVAGDAAAAQRAADTGAYPIPSESTGDGGPATSARLNGPRGIAADGAGNLYVAEEAGARIRRIDKGGIITTIAGNGQPPPQGHNPHVAGDPGPAPALEAQFHTLHDLNIDQQGYLWIADSKNNRVRKISGPAEAPAGNVPSAPPTTATTAPADPAAGGGSTTTTAPAPAAEPTTTTTAPAKAAEPTTSTTAPAKAAEPTTTTTGKAAEPTTTTTVAATEPTTTTAAAAPAG